MVTRVLRKKRLVDSSSLMTWPNRDVVHRMRLEAMTQRAGPFDCDVWVERWTLSLYLPDFWFACSTLLLFLFSLFGPLNHFSHIHFESTNEWRLNISSEASGQNFWTVTLIAPLHCILWKGSVGQTWSEFRGRGVLTVLFFAVVNVFFVLVLQISRNSTSWHFWMTPSPSNRKLPRRYA